jgi:hypothetical protein
MSACGGTSRVYKRCPCCKIDKLVAEFYVRTRGDGVDNYCIECRKALTQAGRYGLTVEEVFELRSQPCAICGTTENVGIDHCHSTLKVRGALCRPCNAGLGDFKDDIRLLQNAIKYLEVSRGRT